MTATIDILTAQETSDLQTAYDKAIGQDQTQKAVWTPVYNLLYSYLTTTKALGVGVPRTDVAVDQQTWL